MLTSAAVEFQWPVLGRGHQWVAGRPVTEKWTIEKEEIPVLAFQGVGHSHADFRRRQRYYPLREASGLFRELASVETTPEAICAFADRYGPLTPGRLFVPAASPRKFPTPPEGCVFSDTNGFLGDPKTCEAIKWATDWKALGAIVGDSFDFWIQNILALRYFIRLSDSIRTNDRATLKRLVELDPPRKPEWVMLHNQEKTVLSLPVRDERDRPTDLKAAADLGLRHILGRFLAETATVGLRTSEAKHKGKLILSPPTLRDAIWLQFALAFNEDKRFRDCEVCGRPFEVSPQFARTNRTLCSPACKAKAHRRRKELALRLHTQGRTERQIAKQVGSQISTVKKWIAESR